MFEWLVFNPGAVREGVWGMGGGYVGQADLGTSPSPSPPSHRSRTAASFHSRETAETQEADKAETSH